MDFAKPDSILHHIYFQVASVKVALAWSIELKVNSLDVEAIIFHEGFLRCVDWSQFLEICFPGQGELGVSSRAEHGSDVFDGAFVFAVFLRSLQ